MTKSLVRHRIMHIEYDNILIRPTKDKKNAILSKSYNIHSASVAMF